MSESQFRRLIDDFRANFKTRDDDVFVVSYAKSGSHWAYDFINMLLRGNLELDNVLKESLLLEMLLPTEGTSKSNPILNIQCLYI